MTQLLDLVIGIVTGLSPLAVVAGLLALAAWRDRHALAETACQVRLTDALADEVGAIVAPVVTMRRGRWRVAIRVPLGQPAVVAQIVRVVHETLPRRRLDRYEVVLTPGGPGGRFTRREDGGRTWQAARAGKARGGTGRATSTSSWGGGRSAIGG